MEDFNLDFLKIYSQNDNAVLADLLKSSCKYDIIDSIIKNNLNKIKAMIGKNLDEERTKIIDPEFFESLKKYFIVKGRELSENELQDLSYFYFAIYNDTLDTYYKLKVSSKDIFYFMLDKKLYNNINNVCDLDFYKLDVYRQGLLQIAYDHDVFGVVLKIFELNPCFVGYYSETEEVLAMPEFKTMVNEFGIEFIARCNDRVIYKTITQDKIDYLKKLVTINPNINLSNAMLDEMVINTFSNEQIASFSSNQLQVLERVIERYYDNIEKILAYYAEIIEINPNVIFYNENYDLLWFSVTSDLMLPANVLAFCDEELQTTIYELYSKCNRYRYDIFDQNLIKAAYYENKIRHLIKKETKKLNNLLPSNDKTGIDEDKPKLLLKK